MVTVPCKNIVTNPALPLVSGGAVEVPGRKSGQTQLVLDASLQVLGALGGMGLELGFGHAVQCASPMC